jgi:hypothetical protein
MKRKSLVETSQRSTTTEPVRATDAAKVDPEFVRFDGLYRMFGIRRGSAYNLIADGEIKSVSLRIRGTKQGVRLIDVQSVREFLARQSAASVGEPKLHCDSVTVGL